MPLLLWLRHRRRGRPGSGRHGPGPDARDRHDDRPDRGGTRPGVDADLRTVPGGHAPVGADAAPGRAAVGPSVFRNTCWQTAGTDAYKNARR